MCSIEAAPRLRPAAADNDNDDEDDEKADDDGDDGVSEHETMFFQ